MVTTDSDGRAIVRPSLGPESGSDNNLFTASVDGSAMRAAFTASGRVAGPPSATAISGVVLDNVDKPLAGVSVRVDGTSLVTQTNAQGQFVITGTPVGYVRLFIDGSTAQRSGTWPTLEFALHTISGQNNPVGMPIYLLPIDVRRGLFVDDTTGGTLTLPELPGFSITVKPGSATFPGGGRTGTVSATLVHYDKVPMTPAFGQQPRFVVTIQPAGTHFDPPAAVTFPNLEGLPPGAITELFSFDHDLGQFVSIGSGSVSEDGSTVKSDPGVGIIKGGWHGSGNPAPTGTAGSLSVTLSGHFDNFDPNAATSTPDSAKTQIRTNRVNRRFTRNATNGGTAEDVSVGSTYIMVAAGSGQENGQYINWEIYDDPADPNDNPAAAHFLTQPTCDGQPTCTAKIIGTQPGIVSARVTFRNTTTNKQTTSQVCKVRFVKFTLKVKSISFKGPGGAQLTTIYKDLRANNSANPPLPPSADPITEPQWTAGVAGAAPKSDPALYVRKDKMRIDLELEISDVQPPGPISNVLIEGIVPSFGKFRKTNVSLPASGTLVVPAMDFATALPDSSHYYKDMLLIWQYKVGSDIPVDFGTTTHDVFVSLEKPLPNRKLYLTSVKLALNNANENNVLGAFQRTWSSFAGPAHIKTWDGVPIYYYRTGFAGSTSCSPGVTDEEDILKTADAAGSSQCTGLASILQGALAVNGMDSQAVLVRRTDGYLFMVKNWNFGAPSLVINSPSALVGFNWRFDQTGPSSWVDMVPPPYPGDATNYGDVRNNLSGLNGQNTFPPAEKVFGNHVFVLPKLKDANGLPIQVSGPYYDPSYGGTYSGVAGFVSSAIAGIIAPLPPHTLDTLAPNHPLSKLARPVNSSDATKFEFCTFETAGSVPCVAPTP